MSPKDTLKSAHRTRRSVVKAASLLLGTVAAIPAASKPSLAQHHGGHDRGCLLRGTRIQTASGYRKVETLSAGDLLPTRFGGTMAIARISSFRVCPTDPDTNARAVRIKRSAIDDNVPSSDLCLTAAHAIFVDGVLVPIGNLVNGTTIVFEERGEEFEFFRIELAHHDVIDAQGAACETFRQPSTRACAPVLSFKGARSELKSRLRSAVSIVVDRRQPLDVIRDKLEERGAQLA
jgi:hypothetical protein